MSQFKLHPQPQEFNLVSDDNSHSPAYVYDTVIRIGRGRFCTAYRSVKTPDVVWLVVKQHEGDYSKEILRDIRNPHVPKLEWAGDFGESAVWKTRYYRKLTAKHKQAWKDYRTLSRARIEAWDKHACDHTTVRGINTIDAVLTGVKPLISEDLYGALESIRDACTNYGGSYVFEFAPRNLAVNDTDRLILLDPVFDLYTIERDHNKRIKKAQASRW